MASILKVDKLDPQSGTALELGTSGDTISVPSGATLDISASTLTPPATMPASSAANLTSIPGGNITGTIAAVSGVNLTSLNASNLGSGTVPTARLPSLGKLLQVQQTGYVGNVLTSTSIDSSWYALANPAVTITPTATDNTILLMWNISVHVSAGATDRSTMYDFQRAIDGGATTDRLAYTANATGSNGVGMRHNRIGLAPGGSDYGTDTGYGQFTYIWADTTYNTTSEITYKGMGNSYSLTAGSYYWANSAQWSRLIAWEID